METLEVAKKVVELLKARNLDAELEYPNDISINVDEDLQILFGTNGENWGGSIFVNEDGCFEYDETSDPIDTHIIAEETNAEFVAGGIFTAYKTWFASVNQ